MFSRSRRKITLSIMGSLILLFAVTLSVILFASYQEIRQRNTEMLERYAEMYSFENQPGANDPAPKPEPSGPEGPAGGPNQGETPMDGRPDYLLSTFYSVAFSDDGTVLAVDDGDRDIYSEEELAGIAKQILAEGKTSGRTGTLMYLVSRRPGYTLTAFMDDTVTQSSMSMLLRNMLIIGGAAIVILFFLSLYLSKQIIRPLEENDKRQKQFVSDASHELKTPVSVIGANAEMLSREIGNNEWLSNIQYENERMDALIRQLLDLSRTENADVQMEQIDFSRLVTGEALAFETLAFDQGKTILSDIEEGIYLTGSRTQLTQIVSVLLDNAVRHSAGGEIGVSLKHHGHAAVLAVANDSPEIPAEKMGHLFDRFYRVDEARSGDGHHYGLGLSIAKAAAEKHGGSITASSSDGKILFTVSIPIKK